MALPAKAYTQNGPGHSQRGILLQLPSGIYVFAQADDSGNLLVDLAASSATVTISGTVTIAQKTCITTTGTISSNTQIVAAVSSKRIKVFAVEWETAYSGGTIVPILTDGSGGTTLDASLLQAITGSISGKTKAVSPPAFFFGTTAGNALFMNPNGQSVTYSVSYFADDAT